MAKPEKAEAKKSLVLLLLRLTFGSFFLYAGLSKIMDPEWTAFGLLTHSQTFDSVYQWFGSPENIGWVNYLNEWGQVLIGVALITGTLTAAASYFGIAMMVLYYFPSLDFPYAGEHGFIVDDHILYIVMFIVIIRFKAGMSYGLDQLIFMKRKR